MPILVGNTFIRHLLGCKRIPPYPLTTPAFRGLLSQIEKDPQLGVLLYFVALVFTD